MIIDFKNNPGKAAHYSVFDAETGECLDQTIRAFYADDETGTIRRYLRDEQGLHYVVDPLTKKRIKGKPFVQEGADGKTLWQLEDGEVTDREPEAAWEEVKRAIRIRPKKQQEPR